MLAAAAIVVAIAAFILLVGAGITALSRTPWPHERDESAQQSTPDEPAHGLP